MSLNVVATEHAVRSQFWYASELVSVYSLSTKALLIGYQGVIHIEVLTYHRPRSHVETFPNHRGLPGDVVQDLKDVYTYGLCGKCVCVANLTTPFLM